MIMKEWKKSSDNFTMDIDDNHYVSYLNRNDYSWQRTSFDIDQGSDDETALIQRSPWKCLILNGDFRKEYETLPDYESCLEFYNSKKEFRSSWSEDEVREVN